MSERVVRFEHIHKIEGGSSLLTPSETINNSYNEKLDKVVNSLENLSSSLKKTIGKSTTYVKPSIERKDKEIDKAWAIRNKETNNRNLNWNRAEKQKEKQIQNEIAFETKQRSLREKELQKELQLKAKTVQNEIKFKEKETKKEANFTAKQRELEAKKRVQFWQNREKANKTLDQEILQAKQSNFDKYWQKTYNSKEEIASFKKQNSDQSQSSLIAQLSNLGTAALITNQMSKISNNIGAINYASARNDLLNPLDYSTSQVKNKYGLIQSLTGMAGGALGAAAGGVLSLGNPLAITGGYGIGSAVTNSLTDPFFKSLQGKEERNLSSNFMMTQMRNRNSYGNQLADLYSEDLIGKGNTGKLAPNYVNMTNMSSYYGNIDKNQTKNIAEYVHKYDPTGQNTQSLSNMIAQISPAFGSPEKTVKALDKFDKNVGDLAQQLAMVVQALNAGMSPNQALNYGFTSNYRGSSFQNSQLNYASSSVIQKLQSEAISNVFGFSTSAYFSGQETKSQRKARIASQQGAIRSRSAVGFKGLTNSLFPALANDLTGIGFDYSAPQPKGFNSPNLTSDASNKTVADVKKDVPTAGELLISNKLDSIKDVLLVQQMKTGVFGYGL